MRVNFVGSDLRQLAHLSPGTYIGANIYAIVKQKDGGIRIVIDLKKLAKT